MNRLGNVNYLRMSINHVLLDHSVTIVETVHAARRLWPVPKQQTDTLSVVGPSDALCDRGTRINLDEFGAVMP